MAMQLKAPLKVTDSTTAPTVTYLDVESTGVTLSSITADALLYGNSAKKVSSVTLGTGLTLTTGTLSVTGAPPTGAAGGDLTGTYPNPTIAANAVTLAKFVRTGTSGQALISAGAGADAAYGTLGAGFGGTGQTGGYAVGDILYASGATALSKLADVAAGSYLRSGGVTTAPLWSTLVLPNAATINYIPYATSANTWGESANLTFDGTTFTVSGNSTSNNTVFTSSGTSTILRLINTAAGGISWTVNVNNTPVFNIGRSGSAAALAISSADAITCSSTLQATRMGVGVAPDATVLATISGSGLVPVSVVSTDAGAAAAVVDYFRNSASPANADILFENTYSGKSSTGVTRVYAKTNGTIINSTNAAEDGEFGVSVMYGGVLTKRLQVAQGGINVTGSFSVSGIFDVVPPGVVMMWPATKGTIPSKWLACDGASLLRSTYADLFAVIGTTYGAADGTHFNVPNFGNVFMVGADADSSSLPSTSITGGATNTGGSTTHTHSVPGLSVSGQTLDVGTQFTDTGVGTFGDTVSGTTTGTDTTGSAGTLPSYRAIYFIIKY